MEEIYKQREDDSAYVTIRGVETKLSVEEMVEHLNFFVTVVAQQAEQILELKGGDTNE